MKNIFCVLFNNLLFQRHSQMFALPRSGPILQVQSHIQAHTQS